MKKNSLLRLLSILIGLLSSSNALAQIVAVSDGGSCIVSALPQTVITNVLANDVVNGVPATLSNVILRQLSTNNPNVQLQADGSVVAANNDELAIIRYEICDVANPNNCASGYIKIFDAFSGVSLPTVTILEPPTCTQPFAKVQLSNFPTDANYSPSGSWVIYLSSNPVDYDYFGAFYSDAGQPAIYENLAPGNYTYILSDIGLDMHHALGGFVIPEADCNIKLTFDGTITDTNTNGIQDAGDVVNYSFAVTNLGSVPLTNVTVTSPGLSIGGGTIASLAAGVTDTTSFTASYVLTASDASTGFFTHFATVSGNEGTNIRTNNYSDSTVLHMPDGIRIIPFQDDNNNGVKDSNEYELGYYSLFGTINYTNSVDGVAHHISSDYDNAHIVYENNPAHTIAMSFTVNNEYSNIYSSTAVVNATVATGSGITNYYIPIAIIPHSDVNVSVHGNTVIRPGTSQNYSITLWNIGVLPVDSGVLTFTKNNLLSLSNASVPTVTTPNGFTHTYYNLVPGERRVITFTIYFPPIPTITNDDLFVFTAAATPDVNEISLNNNQGYTAVRVRNSYDPNNKTEEHNGQILHSTFTSNDYLTYTINFENTGNAEALDITVTDVLDDALDPTTVRMLGASHNYLLDRTGENLNWRFSNINLPVSVTDTSIGKGYLTFRVKPKPGYAVGDVIPNTANIYFDFNPPIVTAPCLTEFVNALATREFGLDHFKYSPNPVKNILKVSNDSTIKTITIVSVLGRLVFEQSVNVVDTTIDLSALSTGIYLVKATSASASKTFKIAKE